MDWPHWYKVVNQHLIMVGKRKRHGQREMGNLCLKYADTSATFSRVESIARWMLLSGRHRMSFGEFSDRTIEQRYFKWSQQLIYKNISLSLSVSTRVVALVAVHIWVVVLLCLLITVQVRVVLCLLTIGLSRRVLTPSVVLRRIHRVISEATIAIVPHRWVGSIPVLQ